ncbi:MAG: GGDEF domain-containing protein [Lachnospiraceae bacterium]|nr:GGDEF domain-containing protein [Lachnospiraceae bacterium]
MDKEKREAYYIIFEKLIDSMNNPDEFHRERFVELLNEFCDLFHIAKGVTEFYKTFKDERLGNGEVIIDRDNGKGDIPVIERRIITKAKAIVKGTLYISKDDEPLCEEELRKVDLMLRAVLAFVSRNRLQRAMEDFAFKDESGYPNFRAFLRFIGQMKEKGGLYGYTAACYNLYHFSVINREIGREAGDMVFRSYYMLMSETIGDDGIVCRLGGDNFIMIFRNEVTDAVLDILEGVPVAYDKNGESRVEISSSAGLFVADKDFVLQSEGDIMERIMPTSQSARHEESKRILFFDEKMLKKKEKMMRTQRRFPEALKKKEFKVFYQPKVNVFTGELVGAEALCRWIRNGKIVPPGEFIPILEQTTDICKLDFYMLEAVCMDIRRWLDKGMNPVRTSVNFSRKHLVDVDLLDHIMYIIDSYNVPHNYIEIELTETTTDVGFKDLKRVVNGLQEQGICTAVDDFGMGYSSLNLIREVPWNILKIDRCFLPLDEYNKYSTTSLMYRHVVSMAQEIGLECVTEGVETAEQVEILRRNHCEIAQGFFFDKPLPVDEFETRMEKHIYELP